MSEIRKHKESLHTLLEDILKNNSGIAIGLLGIGIGWNEDGSERFEVRISSEVETEVQNIFPQEFAGFSINYERQSQPEVESGFWHDLPPDKPIKVVITGKHILLDKSLPVGEKRHQAVANGRSIISAICHYIETSELFPNFDLTKINKFDAFGMLAVSLTPKQCDALMDCESVDNIAPDQDFKVDLLS